jgi:hypothetical protein
MRNHIIKAIAEHTRYVQKKPANTRRNPSIIIIQIKNARLDGGSITTTRKRPFVSIPEKSPNYGWK